MKKILNNWEEKLHMEFSKLGRDYKRMRNKLLTLLPEIARAGIPEKLGFEDIYDYARQVAGISGSAVYRALRLDKKLQKLPSLKAAIEKVGINKVEIAARVANEKNEEFWTDKVLHMSKRPLEVAVKEELYAEKLATGGENILEARPCLAAPEKVKVSLSAEAQKSFNRLKKQMGVAVVGGKGDEKAMEMMLKKLEELIGGVKVVKSERIEGAVGCTGGVKVMKSEQIEGGVGMVGAVKVVEPAGTAGDVNAVGEVKVVGAVESVGAVVRVKKVGRQASAEKKREVYERSEKICEYPGCTKAVENLHHKERFANKKSHETLTALCKAHHEIVHNGFIVNELESPKNWQGVSKIGGFKALGVVDQKLRALRSKAEQRKSIAHIP